MDQQIVKSARLGEEMVRIKHRSGLNMLLCPMKGYSTAYATFTANVGSVDTGFKTQDDAEFVDVPEGIAHFLEHKMFENEEGDAFERYARTGASANAYTSFDKTAYLFACTGNFEQSLEILLDFVRRPYFTKESVQKEQGIIGQEIRMYDDDGDWLEDNSGSSFPRLPATARSCSTACSRTRPSISSWAMRATTTSPS